MHVHQPQPVILAGGSLLGVRHWGMLRAASIVLGIALLGCYRDTVLYNSDFYYNGHLVDARVVATWSPEPAGPSSVLQLHFEEPGFRTKYPLAMRRIVFSREGRKLEKVTNSMGDTSLSASQLYHLVCGMEKPTPPFDCEPFGVAVSIDGLQGQYVVQNITTDREWLECSLGAACPAYSDRLWHWQGSERETWQSHEKSESIRLAGQWQQQVTSDEVRTGKCSPEHVQRLELAMSNFNAAVSRSGLRFLGRRQLMAKESGAKIKILKRGSGELDLWVLGFGVSRVALADGQGIDVTNQAPYPDISRELAYSVDAKYTTRQVLANENETLLLRVFGRGCSFVLLAGA